MRPQPVPLPRWRDLLREGEHGSRRSGRGAHPVQQQLGAGVRDCLGCRLRLSTLSNLRWHCAAQRHERLRSSARRARRVGQRERRLTSGRGCCDVENIAVFVAEGSPPLTAGAPRREPPVLLQHITPADRTERHRWGEPSSAVALSHRHRRAEDRVIGWASAVRTTGVGDLSGSRFGRSVDDRPSGWSSVSALPAHRAFCPAPAPRRDDRQGGQSHQSGIVPGKRSGSPGNMSRQRPH
jgi:hypothetical protein